MEESREHVIGSESCSVSGIGLSPLLEPLSFGFDSFAGSHENHNLAYPFGTPSLETPFPENDNHSTGTIDESDEQLCLNAVPCSSTVRDNEGESIWITAKAKLNGSFFFADVEDATRIPTQLTCYRRNIFGLSGSIRLPRTLRSVVDENGDAVFITGAQVCVSAFELSQGKPTELVHVPLRTIGSSTKVVEKTAITIPLLPEKTSGQSEELRSAYTTIPYEWKRLQFRRATANNGRRRGIQQQFYIRVGFEVNLATGMTSSLAVLESGPIVVRGRNPGNFIHEQTSASKTSVTPQQTHDGKSISIGTDQPIHDGVYTALNQHLNAEQNSLDHQFVPQDFDATSTTAFEFYDSPSWPNFDQNTYGNSPLPQTALRSPSPPTFRTTPPTKYGLQPSATSPTLNSQPINVSYNLGWSASSRPLVAFQNTHQSVAGQPVSPRDDARTDRTNREEPLYEYFPLGLNGWMPPVNAIYRPHIAHNNILIPELKDLKIK